MVELSDPQNLLGALAEALPELLNTIEAAAGLTELVGVKIVGAPEMSHLNQAFRGVDAVTDVLSFPLRDANGPAESRIRGHAGDIALCWEVVLLQAETNGNAALVEAAALFSHGLLHLAGYDHENEADGERMDRLTREMCRAAGLHVEHFGH